LNVLITKPDINLLSNQPESISMASRTPVNDRFNDEGSDTEMQYHSSRLMQQENMYDTNFMDDEQSTLISGDYSSTPGIFQLNHLCKHASAPADLSKEAKLEAEESWEPVRAWLRSHNADEVRQAAEHRGDSSMTALHFACRNQPPIDVINALLSIALVTVQWPDTLGWLPIHCACACGAPTEVIKALAEAFPESKTTVDLHGCTPLHLALDGNQNAGKLASPAVVAILSSSGAAAYEDDNGMLVSYCEEHYLSLFTLWK
jgi:hypothetical protein